jgi:hypothetical protein
MSVKTPENFTRLLMGGGPLFFYRSALIDGNWTKPLIPSCLRNPIVVALPTSGIPCPEGYRKTMAGKKPGFTKYPESELTLESKTPKRLLAYSDGVSRLTKAIRKAIQNVITTKFMS